MHLQDKTIEHMAPLMTQSSQEQIIGRWSLYFETKQLVWSESCKRLFALSACPDENLEPFFAQIHPDDRIRVEDHFKSLFSLQTENFQDEFQLPQHDNPFNKWIRINGMVVRNLQGEPILATGMIVDISPQKTEEIRNSNFLLFFQSVYQHSNLGIAITDAKGAFEQCNPTYANMLGYTEAELRQLDFTRLIHPEDLEENLTAVKQVLSGKSNHFSIENRYVHKDGHSIWVHKHGWFLLDKLSQRQHLVAFVIDISKRKMAELQLLESQLICNLVLTGSALGVWDTDMTTGECRFDERCCLMLGFGLTEMPTKIQTWLELIHPGDRQAFEQALNEDLTKNSGAINIEYRIRHKEGHWIWVQALGELLLDSDGKPVRATGTHLNITDRKRIATEGTELLRQVESLIQQLEQKTDKNHDLTRQTEIAPQHLSLRNREVLALIAEGLTSSEIAGRLGIAYETVVTHRRIIMRKLGLKNKAELIRYALKHNLSSH